MNAESLYFISKVCFGSALLSALSGVILWFVLGIPEACRVLKGREKAAKGEKKPKGKLKIIEDIVITHCVSTLDD